MITELSEEEIEALERKAYEYYDARILELEKYRTAQSPEGAVLSEEDLLLLQQQAKLYFDKIREEALRQKRQSAWREKVTNYLKPLVSIEAQENFTAAQYYDMLMMKLPLMVKKRNADAVYEKHADLEPILECLCCYFAKDDDFYYYAPKIMFGGEASLEKGIALFGPTGVGKTITLEAFSFNPRLSFACVGAAALPWVFEQSGHEGLSKYFGPQVGSSMKHYGQKQIGLLVNEVYGETLGAHYASSCETVERVLYERWERLPGCHTHITTNHRRDELELRYGTRFKSRLVGSMNLIKFPKLPDFRK